MTDHDRERSNASSSHDDAAYWLRVAGRWRTVAAMSLLTILLSLSIVVTDPNTTVGHLAEDINAFAKRGPAPPSFSARALVLNDGSYELFPETTGPLEPSDFPDRFDKEIHVFLRYQASDHGWFGRTTHTRPLYFEFTAWDRQNNPASISAATRRRLRGDVLEMFCARESAGDDCLNRYTQVLMHGTRDKKTIVQPSYRRYRESFRLQHALVGGYVHNIITLIALSLLPYAVVRDHRASRKARGLRRLATENACPTCGYDIRELPTPRCPECGNSF